MPFQASWLQKQLGARLLELREDRRLTTRQVGTELGWAASKVARIERAENQADPQDIIKLGKLYKIRDAEIEQLCEMARASRTDVWWDRYRKWIADSYYTLIGYENDATRVHVLHPSCFPGLLQTRRYIEGLFASSVVVTDPDRISILAEVRQLRQRRLVEQPQPLELVAIIPEAVFYAPYGGDDVLYEQLAHLRAMMDLPNVDLRVLPTSRAVNRLPLSLFEFGTEGSDDGPAMAVSDTEFGNVFHEDPIEIRQTRRILKALHDMSLESAETAELIERRMRETG